MGMMNKGQDFSDGVITPDRLHAHIQNASLTGVQSDDNADGRLIHITTPASPAEGDIRVGTDGIWEASISSVWTDIGSLSVTTYMQNSGDFHIPAGAPAYLDPGASPVGIRTLPSGYDATDGRKSCVGAVVLTAATTGTGTVVLHGPAIVNIRVDAAEGDATPGDGVEADNTFPINDSFTVNRDPVTNQGTGDEPAFLMEAITAPSSGTTTVTAWAFFWR